MKRIEGVTERLLAAAREEFLEKGYEAASLRAIAERAGSSKGAIYVRYADKEALYAAVVDPVIEELCLFFTEEFDGFGKLPADVQQSTMNDYADQGIGLMMDYIYDHLAEFKILVTNGGERYDEFMHRVVELNSATTYRYIEAVGSDAVTAGRLTPELMHMISSLLLGHLRGRCARHWARRGEGLRRAPVPVLPRGLAGHLRPAVRGVGRPGRADARCARAGRGRSPRRSARGCAMRCLVDAEGWVRCPVCGAKTRTKVRADTHLVRFPLYCPKCHRETVVDRRPEGEARRSDARTTT